jgi:DNA-binding transcriptional regulator PaaX
VYGDTIAIRTRRASLERLKASGLIRQTAPTVFKSCYVLTDTGLVELSRARHPSRIKRIEERLAHEDLEPFVRQDLEDELVRLLSRRWEEDRDRDVRAEMPTIPELDKAQ